MHHIRNLTRAELQIILSRVGRISSRDELYVMINKYLTEEDKIIEIATFPLEYCIIHEQIDPNAKKIDYLYI